MTLEAVKKLTSDSPLALRDCCWETIQEHVLHNEMMLCRTCQHIIKCFVNESAFRNYLRFCQSRKRPFFAARSDKHYIVVFEGFTAKA